MNIVLKFKKIICHSDISSTKYSQVRERIFIWIDEKGLN